MQRGKIRQAHKKEDAAVAADKPKIKKLTAQKIKEVYDGTTDALDLSHRGIESIEAGAFAALGALKRLDLSGNKLTRLVFGQPMALTQLKVTSNQLTDVGVTDLSCCKALVTLDLSDNKLARLPGASLRHCANLKALVLTKNHLTSLDWVPSLAGLTSLIVSHNRIADVAPKSLAKLKGLMKLSISHNQLTVLPDMAALDQLTELRASNNALTALPASLNHNVNLKIVDVCHNAIDTFDGLDHWTALTQLKQLNLRGNPLCGKDMTSRGKADDEADDDAAPALSEKDRKALDAKNKMYNYKMKRLFPTLIVRDGQRVVDKRTHGYVAPPPEPKKTKPDPKKKKSKEQGDDEGESKPLKKKQKREKVDEATETKERTKPEKPAKEPKQKEKAAKAAQQTDDEPKKSKKEAKRDDDGGDAPAKKEKGRKKKEKYVKDSGVLSVVHVKKPAKTAAPVDLTQLDTSGGVGLGGESSWD
ncbi:Aste57867_22260 [Aphanomyces stellatus]|uniref:Aste57867_22260 protein n=1 Tax=Aphanomyces stellatus TaxID=120398 RepID=A0A485LPL4_9STRA|nr:hypothetical protein As57867_022190 [Aphanomyces stellatus]VFT98927.1 Aste57867_22260 [Aphanomyces stellatus]